ncbi:MAG TPA: MFS transporter [Rhizomicrobium sp.]
MTNSDKRAEVAPVAGVLASALVFLAGQGMAGTLIGVSAHEHGLSNATIGLIGSSYYLGFIAGCWGGPALIRRLAQQNSFGAVLLLAALATLVFSLRSSPQAWIAARASFGFAAAIVYTLIESWLNHLARNSNRGRVFGSYLLTKQLGSTLGQALLVALAVPTGWLFAVAALLFSVAWIPVRIAAPATPPLERRALPRPLHLWRSAPVGVAICALVGLANGAVWTLAPVYGVAHGFPRGWAGAFMGAFILGGAAIQYPVGWLSDRLDRRRLVAWASLCAAAAGLLLATMAAPRAGLLLGATAFFGMAALPLYGLGVSIANDRIESGERVQTAAALLFLNSLASAAGPALAGLLTERFGIASLFYWTAAVHLAIAAFALRARTAPVARAEALGG